MAGVTETRWQAMARLNRDHPLNVAAKDRLPDGWCTGTHLFVLSLGFWGISEAGIEYRIPGGNTYEERIEAVLLRLMNARPEEALEWLQTSTDDDDGGQLQDWQLDECDTARDAAFRVIDEIASGLIVERPLPRGAPLARTSSATY
jgi:hypothetical protein